VLTILISIFENNTLGGPRVCYRLMRDLVPSVGQRSVSRESLGTLTQIGAFGEHLGFIGQRAAPVAAHSGDLFALLSSGVRCREDIAAHADAHAMWQQISA
jgi:hypothetical protein